MALRSLIWLPVALCAQIWAGTDAVAQSKPEAGIATVMVSIRATADSPYVFKLADFPFEDADDDALTAVEIRSVPGTGTLRVGSAAATVGQTVMRASIVSGSITYYPSSAPRVTSFFYRVYAGGESSDNLGTVNIVLFDPPNSSPHRHLGHSRPHRACHHLDRGLAHNSHRRLGRR